MQPARVAGTVEVEVMSDTAAPAPATAPHALSASPSAPPPQSTSGDAAPQPPSEPAESRRARPIPPLPGVFPDDDPFPSPPSPPGVHVPTRGSDGRFVAPTPTVGEHTLERATPPEPPASKFKFAGEEFDSQEAAEQNFRSLRGQFKPLQSVAKQVGGVDKIPTVLRQAAESARGWKAAYDQLKAEQDASRGTSPAGISPPQSTQSSPGADESADGVDWELYAEIKKLATESGEPWKAEQWLIKETQKAERSRIDKLIAERMKPYDDAQAKAGIVAQTETLFRSLAEYTLSDGSSAYPELQDEQASYEVGRLWASLGLPPEAALTPQGALAAIALYRMAKPSESQARPDAPPTAPPTPSNTDVRAAADVTDGRQMVVSTPQPGGPSAEAARILSGLRQVNHGNHALLGFEP